jgi:hypothetical protein
VFAKQTNKKLFAAIQHRQDGSSEGEEQDAADIKLPEWKIFSQPDSAPQAADFRVERVAAPRGYEGAISYVLQVERLREVNALTGFTRVSSPLDFDDTFEVGSQHRVPLSRKPPRAVPASEVRGEGIFVRFDEVEVARWCARASGLDGQFQAAHIRWRKVRGIEPAEAGYPGIRFVLLHSFSHALMRQVALECGYSSASIRERIYARDPEQDGGPMAGVLLYTAAPDSEGTLGGLVSLGRPERLGRHIAQALEQMKLCASDPLCSEHQPNEGSSATLHGASCHACLFSPETSCERGNKYLDRSVLVETVTGAEAAFFARERRP